MNLVSYLAHRLMGIRAVKASGLLVLALCGWADTGKSTVAQKLRDELTHGQMRADALSTDAFLNDRHQRNALGLTGYDERSVDSTAMAGALQSLRAGNAFSYFPYDNRTGSKQLGGVTIDPHDVFVLEGIHAFHPAVAHQADLRVFIDSDEATLRFMRERANVAKRGMTADAARARIDHEWRDYCAFTLPLKPLAHVLVQVTRNFEYTLAQMDG